MSHPAAAKAQSQSPAPVQEGDILADKYRVEHVLGVGGMGVVVAATHLELEEKVAIKFLLPVAASNDDLVGRFMREAKASVRLKGGHVAKVHDVGRLESGSPYMVMEYLDGMDLAGTLKSRDDKLPIAEAVSYVLQACEGLAEAHSLGIVHRDLKPQNLFVIRGLDGRPYIKVLDFGISKALDPSGTGSLSLTKTEMVLGSPLYMSPEQMRSSKYVDERADIWALGVIAYELLTGRVPFEADSILELCFKVAQDSAERSITHRDEIPAELDAAVMRCLDKETSGRFANIGELAAALEPFAEPEDAGSAARIAAVLGGGTRAPMRSIPEGFSSTPELAVSGVKSDPAISGAAREAAAVSQPKLADESGPPPSNAWGNTRSEVKEIAAPEKARSHGLTIAVAALAASVLVVGGIVAMRGPAPAAPVTTEIASPANATPAPSEPASIAAPSAVLAPLETPPEPAPEKSAAPAETKPAPAAKPAAIKPAPVTKPGPPAASAKPPAASAKPPAASAKPPAASAKPPEPAGGFIKIRE
jgi:eukaryotic-like serine/threonine-protein kinase